MTLLRFLWLVLPLLVLGCDGSGSGKGFPADHCTTNCVTGKERLQIVPAQVTLIPGASQQLHVLLFDSDEDEAGQEVTENLVWQGANTAIATVDAQGRVGGVAAGSTQVSVQLGTLQASVPVRVLDAAITALSVVPAYQLSVPGLTHQYLALASLGSGLKVDVTHKVSWSVSQVAVASVTTQGLVSALAVGSTEIRASLDNLSAAAHLQVVAPTRATLSISPSAVSTPAGSAVLFSARLQLGEQELDVSEQVQWQSGNSAIAAFITPSTPGLASAKAEGGAVIGASLSYQGQSLTAAAQLTVTAAQLTGLRVTPASLSLPAGTRGELRAIASFSDGSSKDVTYSAYWTSADPAVAAVTNLTRAMGAITAANPGNTRITARFGGLSDTADVSVTDARLLALSLQPQSAVVSPGVQLGYTLLAHFSDGSARDVTGAAVFTSSQPAVAVIDSGGSQAGLATAISAGSTSILASYQDRQVSAPLNVLTADVKPVSLSLTPLDAQLLVGSRLQYRALLTLSNGHQQDVTASVRWQTSNANVAVVSERGLASAVSAGESLISIYLPLLRAPALTASARLEVVQGPIIALHLLPASKLSVPGREIQYTALAELGSGILTDVTDQVSWSVSDGGIVQIDGNGAVGTRAAGRSEVKASLGAYRSAAVIQVIDSDSVSLAITPASASAPAGVEVQFSARLTVGAQQLDVTDQVIWRSGAPQVADFVQAAEPGLMNTLAQGTGLVNANFIFKGVTLTATADISVTAATVTGLRITPASLSLPAGNTSLLTAIASFSDGSDRDVTALATWQSADANLVVVQPRSLQGDNLHALAAGNTTVTARFSNLSANAQVTVTEASLLGLSLSPEDAVLSTNVQIRYRLLANYSDGAALDVTTKAAFSSGDPAVAVIETGGVDAGLATALTAGSSEIQASYGGLRASGTLRVVAADIRPQSLTISPITAELLVGSQLQYRAVLTMSNGDQQDVSRSVLWSSVNASVAAIDANGVAIGVGAGSTAIHAQLSGLGGAAMATSATLTVKAAPVTITDFYIEPGQTRTLPGAIVRFRAWVITSEGARQEVTQSATWQSSSPTLAGISGKGEVRALAVGNAQIQAGFSYLGKTYSGSAELSIIAPAMTALEITPGYTKVLQGQQVSYTAAAKLAVGLSVDVTDLVSWTSSNPAIASISTAGMATSLAEGGTLIGASLTYQGTSYTASANLVVDNPEPVLTALMLSPQEATVIAGHQLGYRCKAVFSNGAIYDVTTSCQWRTAAADIAVIDALTGELTGIAAGATTVSSSFTYGGSTIDASSGVTVLPAAVSIRALQVTPVQADVLPAGEQEFFATALLSDGRKLDVTSNVIWRSADTDIATISAKGSARGVSQGQALISASLNLADSTWSDSATLAVVLPDVAVEQLRILPALKLTLPDTTVVYRAELVFADGTVVDVSTLADWSVSNSAVAELVNNRGEVRALSRGDSLVQVSLALLGENYSASAELVVIDHELTITGLELQPNPAVMFAGSSRQLQAFLILNNGDLIDVTAQGQWQTQDPLVASVDDSGVLTGLSEGTATISKSLHVGTSNWLASLTAQVADPATQLAELRVTPTKAEAITGSSVQFTATAIYTLGGSQDVTAEASWEVAKPDVADLTGQAGQVLALSEGNTQVTATYTAGLVSVSDSAKITVFAPDVDVTGFYLIPAYQATNLGGSVSYNAILEYSNNTTQDVTQDAVWVASDTSVAQLTDVPGQFKGLAEGETTISARIKLAAEQHTATGVLAVSNKEPLWIEMSPWFADVQQGQKARFNTLMHYSDGTSADVTQQTSWSSEHPLTATVNNSTDKGLVTGLAAGQTNIHVTHAVSGLSAVAGVNVSSAALLSIALEPASASIPAGYSQEFRAIGTYTGGYQVEITNAEQIYWFSNSPQIADVVSNGIVEGLLAGEATITVGLGNVSATAAVQVTNAHPTQMRFTNGPSQKLVLGGGSLDFAATMTFSDALDLDVTRTANWRTDEQQQAQVFNRNSLGVRIGRVSGYEPGTTTIRASLGVITAIAGLEVIDGATAITELVIHADATTLGVGRRAGFTVNALLADGRYLDVTRDVLWQSSNASVVLINNGIWSGQAFAIGAGQTTISATLYGLSSEITVRVNP